MARGFEIAAGRGLQGVSREKCDEESFAAAGKKKHLPPQALAGFAPGGSIVFWLLIGSRVVMGGGCGIKSSRGSRWGVVE